MKIVVAHEAIDGAGGVETYLAAIVPALVARGHQVAMLYHHGQSNGRFSAAELRLSVQEHGLDGALAALRRWGVDVYFSHNMAPLDVERRALSEWPVVKMMHGYFGTCVSGSKTHGFPSMRACDREFGLGCLALYAPRRCGQLHPVRLVNGYRWARAQRSLFSQYRAIVVASVHMSYEYGRHDVDRERLNVLPLFSAFAPAAVPVAGDAVLFAGRMTTLKGGQLLIEAMAEVRTRIGRDIPLIMAGAGPQRTEWQALARVLGVPVEFPGWVEGHDRAALYSRAAVLAVPSLWPEPFGLVGLEAAAFGVPAVAFDVGGVGEWLRHDLSGRLVRPAEGAQGLAREIANLLADPPRRCRMGQAALETARLMSLETHVEGLEHVLCGAAASA